MLITNFGTIPSQGGLMLPGWNYGLKITIPANSIDADLTNFHCTVILNSSNFDFNKAKDDGSDIAFTDKLFNHYKFEKIEYSKANQFGKFTVLVPNVSDLTDTIYYAWSGNTNAYNTSIEAGQDKTGKSFTYNGTAKLAYSSEYGRRALLLDGGGYFSLANNINDFDFMYQVGTTVKWTAEIEYDATTFPAVTTLFDTSRATSANYGIFIGILSDRKIYVDINRGVTGQPVISYVSTTLVPNDGETHHIEISYDQSLTSNNMKVFIDGTPINFGSKSANTPSSVANTLVPYIGAYSPTLGFANGNMLGMRITNGRVRHTTSFTKPTSLEIDGTDVVFCTSFDTVYSQDYGLVQHMGDNLIDATGNGNNGTGTATLVSTALGKCRQFDGVDDKITTALFTNTDNVTLTVMATKVGTGGTDLLFYVGTSGTNGYGLYTNSLKFSLKATATFADTTVNNTTTPQVVTLTRTSGTWTAIIDGVSYSVTNLSVTTPTGLTYFGGSTTDFYDGQLSNARYSTVARSAAYTKAEQKSLKNTLLSFTNS